MFGGDGCKGDDECEIEGLTEHDPFSDMSEGPDFLILGFSFLSCQFKTLYYLLTVVGLGLCPKAENAEVPKTPNPKPEISSQ